MRTLTVTPTSLHDTYTRRLPRDARLLRQAAEWRSHDGRPTLAMEYHLDPARIRRACEGPAQYEAGAVVNLSCSHKSTFDTTVFHSPS